MPGRHRDVRADIDAGLPCRPALRDVLLLNVYVDYAGAAAAAAQESGSPAGPAACSD
jgi:hypothetical protein